MVHIYMDHTGSQEEVLHCLFHYMNLSARCFSSDDCCVVNEVSRWTLFVTHAKQRKESLEVLFLHIQYACRSFAAAVYSMETVEQSRLTIPWIRVMTINIVECIQSERWLWRCNFTQKLKNNGKRWWVYQVLEHDSLIVATTAFIIS